MDWKAIRSEFETTDITLKALAEKYDVKPGTLKSRKSREQWQRDATEPAKVATSKTDATATPIKETIEVAEPENLTEKQRLFCMHYLKTFNATQSAIKAGYSKDSVHVNGPRMLGNASVREYISQLKQEMQNHLFVDAMDVLNVYMKIAFADLSDYMKFGQKEVPTEYFDEFGNPITETYNYVDFQNYDEVDGTVITEVKQGKDGVSIKLADKMKALEKLEQYFELLPENMKHRVQKEKMQADMAKAQAETKRIEQEQEKEQANASGVFILNDKEAMRKEMERRASRSREDDGHHGPD